jgi:putative dimethyl sulfoxide reductase chaperone
MAKPVSVISVASEEGSGVGRGQHASQDLAELSARRGLVYRFLAALFLREPDCAWLAGISRQGLLDDFPLPLTEAGMAEGLSLVARACSLLVSGSSEGPAALYMADYERLFVGPGHLLAPPWESVYRTEVGLLFDWPTLEVRDLYRQMGLAVEQPEFPDDHVGLELLFMALLSERAAEGDLVAHDVLRVFLNNHLLQWTPRFCDDIITNSETDLYRGMAQLTAGVLKSHAKTIQFDGLSAHSI